MNLVKKLVAAVVPLVLLSAMTLVACTKAPEASSNSNKSSDSSKSSEATGKVEPKTENSTEKKVNLIFHFPTDQIPKDLPAFQEALNKITLAKINATVELRADVFGDYPQKMNAIVASGEKADIFFTSNWNFDYAQNQTKGAFIPLDDLLNKNGQDIIKALPKYALEGTKIGGKTYAIPSNTYFPKNEGFMIQKRYIDKYNLDVKSVHKLEDLEPFLAKIKAGESKDTIPVVIDRNGKWSTATNFYNIEGITNMAGIRINEPNKVISTFESDEYKSYVNLMRSWYQKGYINEDAATLKNTTDLIRTGKVASLFYNLEPGAEIKQKNFNGGQDMVSIELMKPYILTEYLQSSMFAISRTSENPERAMMFLNLLYTDKDLVNLLSFGLEGKEYNKIGDNTIKLIENSGYVPNTWMFGNTLLHYILDGQSPDLMAQTKNQNDIAEVSPILGFTFQQDPVKTEIANITSVLDEYGPGLNTGSVDPNVKLPEFQDKLKKAGIDKVVAEIQKQLDAWKSTKK